MQGEVSGQGTHPGRPIGEVELAELLRTFNELTLRLQGTHEQLRAEVSRLKAELGEANEALERSRRLSALGEMAAGIAHEVRNPLGGIRLYARLLEQDLADRAEPRQTARKISEAAKALDGIVGDVLAFAREFRACPTPVGASELLGRALEECRADSVRASGAVRVELDAPGDVIAHADAALMQRALTNVLRNAFEAVAEGGGRDHRLVLSARSDGRGGVILSVCDTGPGVSEETIRRMFNPFFTTRAAGTGLGLAIVHRIVESHGGSVRVRSDPARAPGTTVEITLPGPDVDVRTVVRGEGLSAAA